MSVKNIVSSVKAATLKLGSPRKPILSSEIGGKFGHVTFNFSASFAGWIWSKNFISYSGKLVNKQHTQLNFQAHFDQPTEGWNIHFISILAVDIDTLWTLCKRLLDFLWPKMAENEGNADLPTIADDLVVTKYKMAAEIVNSKQLFPVYNESVEDRHV